MDSKGMIFKMPLFEVKLTNDNDWKKIPEKELLLKLNQAYDFITPILLEMFDGEEVVTTSAKFRVRI
jgi:hypothetical protein